MRTPLATTSLTIEGSIEGGEPNMRRFTIVRIREALRLKELKVSNVQISRSIQCGRSTLIEVFRRCDELGLDFNQASQMSNTDLEQLLYPAAPAKSSKPSDPDFAYIQKQLEEFPNLNRKFLWEEYVRRTPDPLQYSQFCERFRTWRKENSKEVTLSLERKPGEVMEVDWAGDTMDLLCDRVTGELYTVYLFVATVGNSDLYFAQAFTDMKLKSWIQAHTSALEFFGALPRIVTPDNARTAVNRHVRYEPELNSTYRDWAEFYRVAVIPARPRKPKDKNMVEHGVGYLETWILGRLRHRYFFSMTELNQEIRNILIELNNKPYQKREGTRQSVFQKIDRPAMRPLPTTRFENPEYKTCTVGSNYHIEFERSNYSIPYTYIHKKVTVRATNTTVEILYDNQRICSHARNYNTSRRYVTDKNHMPEKHRGYVEQTDWDGNRYRNWAKKIGPQTYAVVDAMLTTHVIEEQAYKSCMGLLQLSKKYGSERLESACARAAELGGFQYTTVKNILKNDQDQRPIRTGTDNLPLPQHPNIRGSEYYK